MRPSSRAAPGDAASAASTRPAQATACGVGASAAWIGATWAGWMHSLAPNPWRRAQARSDQQAGLVVELWSHTGDRPGEPGGPGGDRQPAGGVAQPVRPVVHVEIEVEGVVEGAEHQAHHAGPAATSSTCATPRALSTRASTPLRAQCPDRTASCGRLGLGQHHAGNPLSVTPQVVGEVRGCAVVDPHDDARPGRRRWRRPPSPDGRAGGVLGVGGDRVLEIEHDDIRTARQSLGETLGTVSRDEQVGPGLRSRGGVIRPPPPRAARGSRRRRNPARRGSRRCARRGPARDPSARRCGCPAAAVPACCPPRCRPRATGRGP